MNSQEQELCLQCFLSLPKTLYWNDIDNPISVKLRNTCGVDHAFTFLHYQRKGIAQKMLHDLKYNGNKEIGALLGSWLGESIKNSDSLPKIDLVIPIPLHPHKLRRRGYNQSEILANGLSEAINAQLNVDLLSRLVHTSTQTKKSKTERWTSMQSIFRLENADGLENKTVMIVDDIITTGATTEAAVLAIKNGKPRSVIVASIASGQ